MRRARHRVPPHLCRTDRLVDVRFQADFVVRNNPGSTRSASGTTQVHHSAHRLRDKTRFEHDLHPGEPQDEPPAGDQAGHAGDDRPQDRLERVLVERQVEAAVDDLRTGLVTQRSRISSAARSR
ncbi:MAG TPA: hypothetical protein VNC14_01720 [Lapillicoccus sp.]|nr:hypothetical protein [Lapillicoccus sp.]